MMRAVIRTTKMLLVVAMSAFSILFVAKDGAAAGGQPGAFLRIPVGARSAGFGNAFVAVADDGSALYFNPAGIAQVEGVVVGAHYALMSYDRSNYSASATVGNEKLGAVGVMVHGFRVSEIERRDRSGVVGSEFDDSENALVIGIARTFWSAFQLGAGVKYVSQSIADHSATGFGFDAGLLVHVPIASVPDLGVRLGASVQNLGLNNEWDTESSISEKVPTTTRLGGALSYRWNVLEFLASVEGSRTEDEDEILRSGLEVWYDRVLALRGGIEDENWSVGVSLAISAIQFDYALCSDVLEAEDTHKIGLQIRYR